MSSLPPDRSFSLHGAEHWLVRLQALSAALAEAATPEATAAAILDSALVAQGATNGALLRVREDGASVDVVLSRGMPAGVYESGAPVPGRPAAGLVEMARGGAPVLLSSLNLAQHPELRERFPTLPAIVARTGIRAAAILPLRIEERTLGLLALGFAAEHPFGDEERAFMLALARQSALALERSRLYEAERAARAEAERTLAQLRAIESVTDTSLVRLPLDQVVRTLAGRVRRVLNSDTATVLLRSEDGSRLEVHTQLGIEEDVRLNLTVPWGVGFAGSIAATGRPRIIEDVPHSDVYSEWVRHHLQAMVGVPLLVEGAVIGVLHAGSTKPRHFTEADVALLQQLADRVALVV
ncbi:MAG TPA: GAF domain-containing protein, partial [Dehalococcoidia bacterium]|nr:GAF domain-containing protein [Dehalococcoidia bacterium]